MATEYNEYRPRTWGEYIPPSCEYKISTIKNCIASNGWADLGALVIDGPNGTGKTTLAQLIARATLCPQRPTGSYDNCGECDVCQGKPHPNIIDYTIKQASEARELFERVLERTRTAPLAKDKRGDRNRYFIVINEFQVVSREAASFLLDALEFPLPHATWILVTMEPERLSDQVRGAIEGRCCHISLTPPSKDKVIEALCKHPKVTREVAEAIITYAPNNYRKAWGELSFFLKGDSPVSVDDIHHTLAKGAAPKERGRLYSCIQNKHHKKAISLREEWQVHDDVLYELIWADAISGEEVNTRLLQRLCVWRSNRVPYPLITELLGFLGEDMKCAPLERAKAPPPTIKHLLNIKSYDELRALI